jgi:hypothetical protein
MTSFGAGAVGSHRIHWPFITLMPVNDRMKPQWLTTTGVGPIRQRRHLGAKKCRPTDHRVGWLLHRRPPDLFHGRKVMLRPCLLEFCPRRADVAGERIALADGRVDEDIHPERLGERRGGLQGTRVGRGDNAPDPLAGELPSCLHRLAAAEIRQRRVDDPRIPARRGEVEVKFALPVAQQDHGRANTGRFGDGQPARPEKCLCPGRRAPICV